jgi:hypothetical protein
VLRAPHKRGGRACAPTPCYGAPSAPPCTLPQPHAEAPPHAELAPPARLTSDSGRPRRSLPEVSTPSCSKRPPLSILCLNRAPSSPEHSPLPIQSRHRPFGRPLFVLSRGRRRGGRFVDRPLFFLVIFISSLVSCKPSRKHPRSIRSLRSNPSQALL